MAPRKYTEAQKQSARKWDAANLDRLSIALPAGSREKIKAHAQAMGESTNAFIGRAIAETMSRDAPGGRPGAAGGPPGGGMVSIPSEALKAAGETVPEFVTRAVSKTAERDRLSRDS